jgi:putative DNA methylase
MSIRSALLIINQVVDEILSSVDSELDPETRWCITWFEKFGFGEGDFGAANQLAQARNVSVDRLARIGLVKSQQSKVKLIERNALDDDWTPEKGHTPAWLALQYLIRYFEDQGGEMEAGRLLRELGPVGSACRDLAYRCFAICERNGWAVEGMPFNSIATSWGEIQKCAVNAEFSPKQETFDV